VVIRRRGKAREQDRFFFKVRVLVLVVAVDAVLILRWKWFCKEWKIITGVYIPQKAVRIVFFLVALFSKEREERVDLEREEERVDLECKTCRVEFFFLCCGR
jgi:hypothetical protein